MTRRPRRMIRFRKGDLCHEAAHRQQYDKHEMLDSSGDELICHYVRPYALKA
jgi:hypothetical protein